MPRRMYSIVRLEMYRWRGFFTRESIFSALRTMAWVVPLTLLIWIYAEREQLWTEDGVPFPVDVKSSDPNRVVRLIKPAEKTIIADLTGPRARLDRLREQIRPQGDRIPIQIEISSNLTPGDDHQISTATVLANHPLFRDKGIQVDDCQPPQLTVRVDELDERPVPVVVPESFRDRLEGSPVFTPATVKVRGPKSLLDQLEQRGDLRVIANLDPNLPNQAALATPGPHEIDDVAVTSPIRDDQVTLATSRVSVALTVRQQDVEYVYPSMPVWILRPENFEYGVEFDEFIANVVLIGPPDKINAIKQPTFAPKPKAYFQVSTEDLPVGVRRSRRLEYDLVLDGVRVKDPNRMIEFELTAPTQNE